MKYCRLCGATPLTPLVVDAGGNQWFRCGGCGCDRSTRAYDAVTYWDRPGDVIEKSPFPLRFLGKLHASCPMGGTVEIRTPTQLPNPTRENPGPYRPENIYILSPGFVEKTVKELGFAIMGKRVAGAEQVWHLKKNDGL